MEVFRWVTSKKIPYQPDAIEYLLRSSSSPQVMYIVGELGIRLTVDQFNLIAGNSYLRGMSPFSLSAFILWYRLNLGIRV